VEQVSTPIMGAAQATAEQMRAYLRAVNPEALDYSSLYLALGAKYGIRGDLAFAQSIHETGYWRFTGTVRPNQNNFAGIGALTSDTRGASFATPDLGIEAQLQHLYGYATTAPLPAGVLVVDPRFAVLERAGLRGVAPNWEDLNGRWAVPGNSYGQDIVRIWQEILQMPRSAEGAPAPVGGPFSDVSAAGWAAPFIEEAVRLGLLKGYENGTFRPEKELTRAELAVLVARLVEKLRQ
jgi:hypothetical protein